MLWFATAAVGNDAFDLFSPRPIPAGAKKSAAENTPCPLDVNVSALSSGNLSEGTWIRCEPEPGVVFTAQVSRVVVDVNGAVSLLAPLDDHEFGFISLSAHGDRALGEIRLPGQQRRYEIRFDPPQNVHVAADLADRDLDELPPGPAVIPPLSARSADPVRKATAANDVAADANTTIDVMIVYTPAAATWAASSGGGINNVVAQAMNRAQQSMDNSSIPITLRLIHSAQVSYTESGNSNTDLDRLQKTSDGYMDVVHTWRTSYGADIVCLMTTASDTGGLGYLLNTTGGLPTYAFNLTRVQQAANTYTVVHEMGHNMGAHHHKEQNTQPGPGLFSYSAGWRWTGTNNARYCSVMTYDSGTYFADGLSHVRVGYFSNPGVNYMGVASGHAADGDNARTLREVRGTIAAYRRAPAQAFSFSAVALDNRVMLRWSNPTNSGFASQTVLVRHGSTNYPAATNQGSFVYQGTDQQFLHTNVVARQPNYYTIWASDDGSSFIEP